MAQEQLHHRRLGSHQGNYQADYDLPLSCIMICYKKVSIKHD